MFLLYTFLNLVFKSRINEEESAAKIDEHFDSACPCSRRANVVTRI